MATCNAFLVGVMTAALLAGLGMLLGAVLSVAAASASFVRITTGATRIKEGRP